MKLKQVDFVHSVNGPGKDAQTGTCFQTGGKFGRQGHDLTFEGGFVKIVSHADRTASPVLVPVHNVASMVPLPGEATAAGAAIVPVRSTKAAKTAEPSA